MFAMLWVHNDLVFVCGLDVSQQFPFIRCYFLSQKEHLIDNEKIISTDYLSKNLQVKKIINFSLGTLTVPNLIAYHCHP